MWLEELNRMLKKILSLVLNYDELPEWKKRALSDPAVTDKQAKIIMEGPKCLTDAWFLQAMRFKYLTRGMTH